jgi:phage shock protein C
MNSPYPHRLERSRTDRLIGGVCGGLAKYLNMDPTLVRILTVLVTLFTGVPVILYVVALLVMPEESSSPEPYRPVTTAPPTYQPYGSTGTDPVWGAAGAPWEQPQAAQPAKPQNDQGAPADHSDQPPRV